MEKPLPELLALVIADHVYHDDISAKLFILGARMTLTAPSFPTVFPQLTAYVVLVEGRGIMTVQVRLVDVDEERQPVFENETEADFLDPLTEVQLLFDMRDLVFPDAGEYRLQLRVDGRFIRERRLVMLLNEN